MKPKTPPGAVTIYVTESKKLLPTQLRLSSGLDNIPDDDSLGYRIWSLVLHRDKKTNPDVLILDDLVFVDKHGLTRAVVTVSVNMRELARHLHTKPGEDITFPPMVAMDDAGMRVWLQVIKTGNINYHLDRLRRHATPYEGKLNAFSFNVLAKHFGPPPGLAEAFPPEGEQRQEFFRTTGDMGGAPVRLFILRARNENYRGTPSGVLSYQKAVQMIDNGEGAEVEWGVYPLYRTPKGKLPPVRPNGKPPTPSHMRYVLQKSYSTRVALIVARPCQEHVALAFTDVPPQGELLTTLGETVEEDYLTPLVDNLMENYGPRLHSLSEPYPYRYLPIAEGLKKG